MGVALGRPLAFPANRMQAHEGVTTALQLESSVLPIGAWQNADITVFDPAKVIGRPTVDEPAQTSERIRYPAVRGVVVIDEGIMDTEALPGRPIRRTRQQGDRD